MNVHKFEQDPDIALKLCKICGWWPTHHNHTRAVGTRCICGDCINNPNALPEFRQISEEEWENPSR